MVASIPEPLWDDEFVDFLDLKFFYEMVWLKVQLQGQD